MSSCWEPASSARRSRSISPSAASSVALVDRGGPGEGTSYGNTGIIEGNTIFPAAFPSDWPTLLRIALKRSPEANYHLSFLPKVAPWLLAFRAASQPERLLETAQLMRPLFARAVAEHEALSAEAGAERYLRHTGWLKLYRSDRAFRRRRRASSNSRRASASPMCRSIATPRARSSRRSSRCFAMPCTGPAR